MILFIRKTITATQQIIEENQGDKIQFKKESIFLVAKLPYNSRCL